MEERITQRLYYLPAQGSREYPLDLIPFVGVERQAGAIE